MFKNIGATIKNWAKGMFYCCSAISIIVGLVTIILPIVLLEDIEEVMPYILAGIIIIFVGVSASFVVTCLLYAVGQITENTDIMAGRRRLDPSEIMGMQLSVPTPVKKPVDNRKVDLHCPECSAQISYPWQMFKDNKTVFCQKCGKKIEIDDYAKKLILENFK